jgi:cell fate (sporulation/competence/biofilm development) regulator YlbF (YheA/YmcA/DUF963 family)
MLKNSYFQPRTQSEPVPPVYQVTEPDIEASKVGSRRDPGVLSYAMDAKEVTAGVVESHRSSAYNLPALSLDASDEDKTTFLDSFVNDINTQFEAVQARNDLSCAAKCSLFKTMCEAISEKLRQEVEALEPQRYWLKVLFGLDQHSKKEIEQYTALKARWQEAQDRIDEKRGELIDILADVKNRQGKFPQSLKPIEWTDAADMARQYNQDIKILQAWERDVLGSGHQRTKKIEPKELKAQLELADKYLELLKLRYAPDKCALSNNDLEKRANELLEILNSIQALLQAVYNIDMCYFITTETETANGVSYTFGKPDSEAHSRFAAWQQKVQQMDIIGYRDSMQEYQRAKQLVEVNAVLMALAANHSVMTPGSPKTLVAGSPRATNVAGFFPGAEAARRKGRSDVVDVTVNETNNLTPASAV